MSMRMCPDVIPEQYEKEISNRVRDRRQRLHPSDSEPITVSFSLEVIRGFTWNYSFIGIQTMSDDTFVETFSVFRNVVNPSLRMLQDQLLKKLGEVIEYSLCDARYCCVWTALLSQTHYGNHIYDLDNIFKISDSQPEQAHELPSNGNCRRAWIMIKVMND